MDSNPKTATASTTLSVIPPSQYTLSWQGFVWDGGGEETLTMNGLFLASLPTVDTLQNSNVYVSFSLNVTSFIVQGTNKLTFTHANWDCSVSDNVRNLQLTTGITVVYTNSTVEPLPCTPSLAYAVAFAPSSSPPALTASFSYTPINPSTGQSVTLTATAAGGVGPYTFNWNFGDGSTGSGSAVTHTYGQGATFTVKVTVTDSAQNIATSSQQVTITSALTSTFTSSPSTITPGSPMSFTATVSAGTSPYSYSWNFGDGATGTGNPTSHTYSAAGPYTVTLTVTDSKGNTATASQTLTGTLITSFTYSPSSPETSQSVTFSGTASGGTTPYSFSWNFGDGATGTGTIVTHNYTSAQSFTITETATDSSSPQQSAASSQTVTVVSSLTGNFGVCNSLPQGWNCGNLHPSAPSPSSAQIVTGVFQSRQSNPGLGGSNDYYYSTTQKGTFPWTPCSAPASGVIPSGTTSVSVNFTSLYYNPGSSPSSDRYDIYISLYYWLPNGPVSAGGSTYQCLDTQVRVENIGGTFSPIGSTATYDPGDAFGWDNVTLQVSPGQNGLLIANVANQCLQDLKAWGLPTNTPCQLAGIEIGTEAYQFQELDVNWYDVNLNVGPIPLSTSFTISPSNPIVNTPVTFTSTTTGGTSPYTTTWNFGDGSTGTGASVTHAYLSAGNFTVTLTVKDSGSPQQTATSQKLVKIPTSLAASFVFDPSSPEVGLQITFTGSASGGTAPYGFSWAFGDGGSSSANPAAHSYSSTGSFTVTLTVRDANSATATSSQTISVASAPSVSFNYSPPTPEAAST